MPPAARTDAGHSSWFWPSPCLSVAQAAWPAAGHGGRYAGHGCEPRVAPAENARAGRSAGNIGTPALRVRVLRDSPLGAAVAAVPWFAEQFAEHAGLPGGESCRGAIACVLAAQFGLSVFRFDWQRERLLRPADPGPRPVGRPCARRRAGAVRAL